MLHWTLRKARQLVVAVVGVTVVLIGIIMIFTPGPAIVVIPLGLGILAHGNLSGPKDCCSRSSLTLKRR